VLNVITEELIIAANEFRQHLEISWIPVKERESLVIKPHLTIEVDNEPNGSWLGVDVVGGRTVFKILWEMPTDNVYLGPVYGLSLDGDPSVVAIEW